MGRYSRQLSPQMAEFAGVRAGQRVVDVGCGPGALTAELVHRLGADAVAAADPSAPFVAAVRTRFPGVRVEQATAEQLPFEDDSFDAALAQLVVHFMNDPIAGLREMARITKPGGVVAASVWDYAGGNNPIEHFWAAVREMDPGVRDEARLAGAREGHLAELLAAAGLQDIDSTAMAASVEHTSFEQWWEPFTLGVGPAGAYVAGLDEGRRAALIEACRRRLPAAPFTIDARAWAAKGRV